MSDETRSAEPTPAVPLDYFERQSGPWTIVLRWIAWTIVGWSILAIASDLAPAIFYFYQGISTLRLVMIEWQMLLLSNLPHGIAASMLLLGGILLLRGSARGGRLVVIWSLTVLIAINLATYGLIFLTSTLRYSSRYGTFFILYRAVMQAFTSTSGSFVPAVLILLFRKREMREACEMPS
jgi:hypothetical protein